MELSEVVRRHRGYSLSGLKGKVLQYLEEHADEVFPYRDERLSKSIGAKPSAVSWTLWWLHMKGLVDRVEVDGHIYFGARRAIAELRRRLGLSEQSIVDKARALQEQIRKRAGDIDVEALLDDIRGPWE